jgi:predicted CopG family antitoxin
VHGGKANMDEKKKEKEVVMMVVGEEEEEEKEKKLKGGMEKENVLVRGVGAGGEGLATV